MPVDTTGPVVAVTVRAAGAHDRDGATLPLGRRGGPFPRLGPVWADRGYAGEPIGWAGAEAGVVTRVVYPWWRRLRRDAPGVLGRVGFDAEGLRVLPRRWVVGRSFAWSVFQGRLARDYEWLGATTDDLVCVGMIRLMLRRLTS